MSTEIITDTTSLERAKNMVSTFPYLMKVFHRLGAGAVSELEITLPQYQTLVAFTVRDTWSVSDLALFLQIKPPAASELVDRLVKAEFIERETNPNDRRQTILT
ncbi:MAG: MarR family transcriptional regulator, partial [bacterium]|nr:MarR family transcriptional regulator [bacterium]